MKEINFAELQGKTVVSIHGAEQYSNCVTLVTSTGEAYRLQHDQDCCEAVYVEDVIGDIQDILGEVLLVAEEVEGSTPEGKEEPNDSYTWTFYKLDTCKGGITIRWLGKSNGYYSEKVTTYKLIKELAFISRHEPTASQRLLAAIEGYNITHVGNVDAFSDTLEDDLYVAFGPKVFDAVSCVHQLVAMTALDLGYPVATFNNINRAGVGEKPMFETTLIKWKGLSEYTTTTS